MDKKEKEIIKISVRSLVEFILRKGDLDNRRSAAFDREAMLKGGKIHRKIQKQMKASYRPEVSLKWEQEYEDFIILVEGRDPQDRGGGRCGIYPPAVHRYIRRDEKYGRDSKPA